MFERLHPDTMLKFKKWAYLLVFVAPLMLVLSGLQLRQGEMPTFWAFFTLIFIFGIVPLLDYIVGKDPANPDEKTQVPSLSEERIYRVFTLICFPVQLAILAFAGWTFVTAEHLSLLGQLGWLMSSGVVGGVIAINVGHELSHKDPKLENWTGGLLLACVTYAGFKVEHVRGHHVHVSTPEDASSSQYNQGLYDFLPKALVRNFKAAWRLEKERLNRKGKAALSASNELIWWYGFSALLAVVFYLTLGWMGVLFFVAQSFFAGTTLEIINYIEHYGLHRRKLENGKYERVTPAHSWNSNYLLTNLFLFHLQRHSDHHAYPKRRYQVLRHYDESPQLPGGYASMFVLALVPPLWKKVMNPRVEAYYRGELDQLFREQKRVSNIA